MPALRGALARGGQRGDAINAEMPEVLAELATGADRLVLLEKAL